MHSLAHASVSVARIGVVETGIAARKALTGGSVWPVGAVADACYVVDCHGDVVLSRRGGVVGGGDVCRVGAAGPKGGAIERVDGHDVLGAVEGVGVVKGVLVGPIRVGGCEDGEDKRDEGQDYGGQSHGKGEEARHDFEMLLESSVMNDERKSKYVFGSRRPRTLRPSVHTKKAYISTMAMHDGGFTAERCAGTMKECGELSRSMEEV